MTKAERLEKQKNRADELKKYEREYSALGHSYIAGVDEVGRGPLAGPVVASCVILNPEYEGLGIDDSKKITEKNREKLYDEIRENSLCYGFGLCDNNIIDDINILEATKKAMKQAIMAANKMLIEKLRNNESVNLSELEKNKTIAGTNNQSGNDDLLIDLILVDAVTVPGVYTKQISLVHGDATSISIAAASILAKVKRDRMMIEYDDIYPGYGFASNKGYGTAAHYAGIKAQGITPIHRKTFLKNI